MKDKEKEYSSKEIQFIRKIMADEGLDNIKHPVLGIVVVQLFKLLEAWDKDEKANAKIKAVLNRIKGEWGKDANTD